MRLITVGTGSDGNCYLLERNLNNIISLDCGIPWKKVMIASNFRPSAIDFALVTHDHRDHNGYMRDFIRNGIEVFSPDNLNARMVKDVNGVKIIPFEVPHDTKCYGYLIDTDDRRIIYMTDFGYCRYRFTSWSIDTWIIACNHILPDTREAKFSHVVRGHSSLETVKDLLAVNNTEALRNVVIVHYSEGEDTERMRSEIQQVVGDGVNVTVAQKRATIDL